ncbi:hypothetical protein EVAR_39536_1 [Eumeta japonica]|uniref:Uncharacterized protein n=1 Tax=Eumeta variegata TaxID=151549 RepID=A0A4C1XMW2_EUMVA|nr:hypothetical protein EVAR_39536_1 [Eumeta japonica]
MRALVRMAHGCRSLCDDTPSLGQSPAPAPAGQCERVHAPARAPRATRATRATSVPSNFATSYLHAFLRKRGLDRRTDGRTDGQQSDPIRVPFFPFEQKVADPCPKRPKMTKSLQLPAQDTEIQNLQKKMPKTKRTAPYNLENLKKALEESRNGGKIREIALKYGISKSAVRFKLKYPDQLARALNFQAPVFQKRYSEMVYLNSPAVFCSNKLAESSGRPEHSSVWAPPIAICEQEGNSAVLCGPRPLARHSVSGLLLCCVGYVIGCGRPLAVYVTVRGPAGRAPCFVTISFSV